MKVFAISDLHLSINNPKPMNIFGAHWDNYLDKILLDWNNKVSDEDIVLLAGDLSWAMYLDDAMPDIQLIAQQKGRKVLLRGNHDYWWKAIGAVRKALPAGMFAVQNDAIRLSPLSPNTGQKDVVVFGTRGWLTDEKLSDADKTIYLREIERLKLSINSANKLKENANSVCMMHYPPFNAQRHDSPFTQLLADFQPNAVVYGHLHGKDSRADLTVVKNGIHYYLTSCDLTKNTLTEIPL